MATSLGNINLIVSDLARSRTFYADVLGLEVDTRRSAPPSFVLFRAGTATVTLQEAGVVGATVAPSDGVEVGFEVDDVEAVQARLAGAGVEVSPVQSMGWGRAVDARDPDGYRVTAFARGPQGR